MTSPSSENWQGRLSAAEIAKFRVCDNCRIKKIRCDMKRPSCDGCRMRGLGCIYSQRRRKPGPPRRRLPLRPTFEQTDSSASPSRTAGFRPSPPWQHVDTSGFPAEAPLNGPRASDCMPELSPETEDYLLDLYFEHVQPIYPLFRKPRCNAATLPPRLKMAVFAVSSRFAAEPFPFTPADFAQRADIFSKGTQLSIDEIKASLLLCVYAMSNPIDWNAIAEVGRVMRMADLYDTLCAKKRDSSVFDDASRDGQGSDCWSDASDCDVEEWKSVWWSIYSLDTCCNTLAVTSPASVAQSPPGRIELPSLSLSDFTDSLRGSAESNMSGPHPLPPSSNIKNWEIMREIFTQHSCRNRNFYLGACHVMRAATELRTRIRHERDQRVLQALLQEFESECAATLLALPSWVSNPMRNFAAGEADKDHRSRLDTLLLFRCASMLVTVVNAQVKLCASSSTDSAAVARMHWQHVVSKAGETVQVVQNWRPEYFDCVDPMCSYIVFVTAAALVLDCQIERSGGTESVQSHSSGHLDLLALFLDRIGRYWEIGRFLGGSLRDLRQNSSGTKTYEAAVKFMSQLAHPMSDPALSGSRRTDHSIRLPINNSFLDPYEPAALAENNELGCDFLGAMAPGGEFDSDWLDDINSSLLGTAQDENMITTFM